MLLLLDLLVPVLPAEDGDDAIPTHQGDVDTTRYTRALYDTFTACLAVEGTVLEASDPTVIQETLDTLAPVLHFYGDGRCTASSSAVTACADAVTAMPCEALDAEITSGLSGGTTAGTPDWAQSYGNALIDRIGSCYAAETGVGLTVEENADLHTFSGFMAQALTGVGAACPVDLEKATACIAAVGAMPCGHLSSLIADDSAADESELLVQDFLAGCPGFLDCE
jgi:hypothetical protein